MKKISTVGLDLAKNFIQVCGADKNGKILFNKKMPFKAIESFIGELEKDNDFLIAMEACGSSNYWARLFIEKGFRTVLMAPQHVKPYVKNNKNDAKDAEAIVEACRRPNMTFVSPKTREQQSVSALHKIRDQFIKQKVSVSNQVRALLFEYGIIEPLGANNLIKKALIYISDDTKKIDEITKHLIQILCEEYRGVEDNIKTLDEKIKIYFQENEMCQRIAEIEGVGVITATAIVAKVGVKNNFKNGREFAAYLGLTPKHTGSGGKVKMEGISKRGDAYIRKNLVHGSRAVIRCVEKKTDKKSLWVQRIKKDKGYNKAAVALANKTARIIWVLITKNEVYKKAA